MYTTSIEQNSIITDAFHLYNYLGKTYATVVSMIDTNAKIDNAHRLLRRRRIKIEINETPVYITSKEYDMQKLKLGESGYSHLMIKRKTFKQDRHGDIHMALYMPTVPYDIWNWRDVQHVDQNLCRKFYQELYRVSSIPMLEEWAPHILLNFARRRIIAKAHLLYDTRGVHGDIFYCVFGEKDLTNVISTMLRDGTITMGNMRTSEQARNVQGLDGYLSTYNEQLARKVEEKFTPVFSPEDHQVQDNLIRYSDFLSQRGINLFDAQLNAVQAASKNLKDKNVSLFIAECGSGKTIMSIATLFASTNKDYSNSMILVPSHLTKKWIEELNRYLPNSRVIEVKTVEQMAGLEQLIKTNKTENIVLVISQSSAKIEHQERPCAIWKHTKITPSGAFHCPKCGKEIYHEKYDRKEKTTERFYLNEFDSFSVKSKKKHNEECNHCHEPLWTYANEGDKSWTKVGANSKAQWFMVKHIDRVYRQLSARAEELNGKEKNLLMSIAKKKAELEDGESSNRKNRRYQLAKYIHQKYAHTSFFDFFVADELHEYKGGDSQQGQAFSYLAETAKNVIGLTGTLLNGYSSGLFYILYRLFPERMAEHGYYYEDIEEFKKDYGVTKTSVTTNMETHKSGPPKKENVPGVSPLVFTDFLMENSVFVSLGQMKEGLPNYTEIPLGVNMDEELRNSYRNLRDQFVNEDTKRYARAMAQNLNMYLDCTDIYPIYNENKEAIIVPNRMHETVDYPLTNKEWETVNLIKRKVEQGEKVLLYYAWDKNNLVKRLNYIFKSEGINAAIMTSSVSSENRKEWIDAKIESGIDVLACNPKLVETGLDLLDFTTIIFYQVNYNLFTLRQASRRSWRLSQTKDIEVYFIYYNNTIQEKALNLMATKLKAAQVIEGGNFTEEGLKALSNSDDIISQIARSVVEDIESRIEQDMFDKHVKVEKQELTFEEMIEQELYNKKETTKSDNANQVVKVNRSRRISPYVDSSELVRKKIPYGDINRLEKAFSTMAFGIGI